jgi:hypothetical protein
VCGQRVHVPQDRAEKARSLSCAVQLMKRGTSALLLDANMSTEISSLAHFARRKIWDLSPDPQARPRNTSILHVSASIIGSLFDQCNAGYVQE